MKKFYLIAAALLSTSLFTTAKVPAIKMTPETQISLMKKVFDGTNLDVSKIKTLSEEQKALFSVVSNSKKAAKAPARAFNKSDYQKLSDARIKDPFLSYLGWPIAEIYNANVYQEIDQDESTTSNTVLKNNFVVDNPMKNSQYAKTATISLGGSTSSDDDSYKFFTSSSNQMYIYADDEERVYASSTDVCNILSDYKSYFGGTKVKLVNIAGYYIENNMKSSAKPAHYGKYYDNVITFPAGTMYIFIDDTPVAYYAEDYAIALSGGKIYSTGVALSSNYVNSKDEDLTAYIYYTGDFEDTDYFGLSIYPGYGEPDESTYKYGVYFMYDYGTDDLTEEGGIKFNLSSALYELLTSLGMEIESIGHLPVTIMSVPVRNDNYIAKSGSMMQLFYQEDESANYKSIGTGKFREDFVASIYGISSTDIVDVELEEDQTTGTIRIVNPMKNIYPSYLNDDYDRYIYLNINEDEETPIYIEVSDCGVNGSYGEIFVASASYMDYDEEGGTWDETTNTITFPESSLLVSERGWLRGAWSTANNYSNFLLQLPENYKKAGVNDIAVDNADSKAPVEYYNLQGVRIENPTAGQLVIRRQGSKATKQIIR